MMPPNRFSEVTRRSVTAMRPLSRRGALGAVLAGVGLLAFLFGAALPGRCAAAQKPAAETLPVLTVSNGGVETGGVLLVRIDASRMRKAPEAVRVLWEKEDVRVFPFPGTGPSVYAALVAIPLSATPGKAALTVAWQSAGRQSSRSLPFEIRAGAYGEEALTVDPRHVRPSPTDLARIDREQRELAAIYTSGSRSPLWRGGFLLPVPGEINGPFGTRRLFNGELRSHHTGLDFRAQAGDPVQSANAGIVRLAKELFYSGNAVVVDHGAGVFTSYSHLSRIDVAPGQKIEKGRVVGLIGATGRATGPHLHWGVKVNSISVSPLLFVQAANRMAGD